MVKFALCVVNAIRLIVILYYNHVNLDERGSETLTSSEEQSAESLGRAGGDGNNEAESAIRDENEGERSRPTPSIVEPARPTPSTVEPARPTPSIVEPARPTPSTVEPARPTPSTVEPARSIAVPAASADSDSSVFQVSITSEESVHVPEPQAARSSANIGSVLGVRNRTEFEVNLTASEGTYLSQVSWFLPFNNMDTALCRS